VEVKKMQQENEQNNNNFVSKIIIIIEGKEVHLSSESTSLKDFGIHISQLNLIDKEGNHMISQIQQPITEYKRVIPKNIHKEILDGNSNLIIVDRTEFEELKARVEFLEKENVELRRENAELRRENAELRKQVITLQTICDKYFNLYGPLPTI
jgi:FtsZ-binding cell division protein ZapB